MRRRNYLQKKCLILLAAQAIQYSLSTSLRTTAYIATNMVVRLITISKHSILMITSTFLTNQSLMAILTLQGQAIRPATTGHGQQVEPQIHIGEID